MPKEKLAATPAESDEVLAAGGEMGARMRVEVRIEVIDGR
jgi:hypothetical protein